MVGDFSSGTRVSSGDFARVEDLEQAIFWLFMIGTIWFFFPDVVG